MQEYILNVFDLVNVSFRTEADNVRVQKAHEYAESLYQELRLHGGNLTRDRLLAILLLGITDALLQQKKESSSHEEKLNFLLKKIDDFLPSENSLDTSSENKTSIYLEATPSNGVSVSSRSVQGSLSDTHAETHKTKK